MVSLAAGDERVALHMFRALGVEPRVWEHRIGGSALLLDKPVPDSPGAVVVMTCGASRITPPEGQLPIEFAIELLDGQQDAAQIVISADSPSGNIDLRAVPASEVVSDGSHINPDGSSRRAPRRRHVRRIRETRQHSLAIFKGQPIVLQSS